MMLAVMIEGRDGYTHGHCHRLANYATAFGRRLGLDSDDLQSLHRGGFLHDIGMLAIPDDVLRKEGPLSGEEYEVVTSHTVIGDRLCANLRSLNSVRPIVRHHHEKCDGSGYPTHCAAMRFHCWRKSWALSTRMMRSRHAVPITRLNRVSPHLAF